MIAVALLVIVCFVLFFALSFSSDEKPKQKKHRDYQELQRQMFREAEQKAAKTRPPVTSKPSQPPARREERPDEE